jgi:hypothetical protein
MWWWLACGPGVDSERSPPDDSSAIESDIGETDGDASDTTNDTDPPDDSDAPEDTGCGADCPPPCGTFVGSSRALDLSSATLGEVVRYEDSPSLPLFPVDAVDGGAPLLFSDSPESPTGPASLYSDVVDGKARIYVYHANGDDVDARLTVVAEAVSGPANVRIDTEARSGPWNDYLEVGRKGALRWLNARITPPAARSVAVPASGRVLLDATLDGLVARPSWLGHAIYEVETDAPVRFTVAMVGVGTDATAATLRVAARDVHDRGTFLPSEREVSPLDGCYDTAMGATRLRIGGGSDWDPWPTGRDAVTGSAESLRGAYGMAYTLRIPLRSGDGRRLAALMVPRGGAVVGAAWASDGEEPAQVFEFPVDAHHVDADGSAVVLGRWDAARDGEAVVVFTPAGSTSLPVDIVLQPY